VSSERLLVFNASAGLANRLRALVGYRALAELRGMSFGVHWPVDRECPAAFQELFDSEGWGSVRFLSKAERDRESARAGVEVFREPDWFRAIWRKHGREVAAEEAFVARSRAHLRGLVPHEEVRHSLDGYLSAHNLGLAVGFHLRLTDNVPGLYDWSSEGWAGSGRLPILQEFANQIEAVLKAGRPVLLSTDHPGGLRAFRARFPELWWYPKIYSERSGALYRAVAESKEAGLAPRIRRAVLGTVLRSRSWRPTSMQDAVADLWLLSRCRHVVATRGSSFGPLAAEWGGVECAELVFT
jgi:hypothetical protein